MRSFHPANATACSSLTTAISDSMYKLVISKSQAIVEATVWGYWSAVTAERFCSELRDRLGDLPSRPHGYAILCDLDGGLVAPVETIAILATIMGDPAYEAFRARHIAIFAKSPLVRLQFDRLADTANRIGVFEDRVAAQGWLYRQRNVVRPRAA